MSPRTVDRLALLLVCLIGLAWVSHGMLDETQLSLDGDSPRYLLNGVFMRDAIATLPITAPLQYAREYYARYPALSLGHHPVLPAVIEAPFYLLFGVSVFSARLSALFAFLVAIVFWFRLTRDIYDTPTATFASLLFLTTPGLVSLYQVVLSEPYTLSLVVVAVYFMHRYTTTGQRAHLWAFVIASVLSVYAKQLAAFMAPVYAFQYARAFGLRALIKPRAIVIVALLGLCVAPLVPLTLKYSQFNISLTTDAPARAGGRLSTWNFLRFVRRFWSGEFGLTPPLLVLTAISLIAAVWKRDRRALLFAVWIAAIYGALVGLGVANDRFACYWLPAFAALGAATYQLASTPRARVAMTIVLTACVSYQAWVSQAAASGDLQMIRIRPIHAAGYEEAAAFVADQRLGDSVLYSASVDTGYFVFFARKHDPQRNMIVLRADKVLTTSRMRRLDFERHVAHPEEIPPLLQRYGVGYVVIEDGAYPAGPLQWLQDIVTTPDFELRRRIPIASSDRRLQGATLSIYEFKGRKPADPDAGLSLGIPLMDDRIEMPIGDLIRSAPSR